MTVDDMRYISLFESLTGATTRDCLVEEEGKRLVFVVEKGNMGLAIGKGGTNIKRARKIMARPIDVVEYRETPEDFIKASLLPARVRAVKVSKTTEDKKVATVTVEPADKGVAIGKDGRNISRVRVLSKRYFDLDNVLIT